MTEESQLIVREDALTLPDPETFRDKLRAINEFQQIVHANLILGQDFGIIPGTTKPTLLKPGAEKTAKLLNLADEYEIIDRQEDWQGGFFRYLTKCKLRHIGSGIVVSEGMGECNSMEAKYRWRESKRICPICGAETIIKGKAEYGGGWLCFKKQGGCGAKWPDGAEEIEAQSIGRVENEDIYSQVNTILKMSKKRALVDAALSAGRLSNVFTQDIEDTPHRAVIEVEPETGEIIEKPEEKPEEAPKTKTSPKPKRDPASIKTVGDMTKACFEDFGLQPAQVLKELGVSTQSDIVESPKDCYLRIVAVMSGPKPEPEPKGEGLEF